jgi:hypothetical protein
VANTIRKVTKISIKLSKKLIYLKLFNKFIKDQNKIIIVKIKDILLKIFVNINVSSKKALSEYTKLL